MGERTVGAGGSPPLRSPGRLSLQRLQLGCRLEPVAGQPVFASLRRHLINPQNRRQAWRPGTATGLERCSGCRKCCWRLDSIIAGYGRLDAALRQGQ